MKLILRFSYWYRYEYIDIVISIAWVLSWIGWISSSRYWYWYRTWYQYINIYNDILVLPEYWAEQVESPPPDQQRPENQLTSCQTHPSLQKFVIVFLSLYFWKAFCQPSHPSQTKRQCLENQLSKLTHHCTKMSLSCYSFIVNLNNSVHETSSDAHSTNTSLRISISC